MAASALALRSHKSLHPFFSLFGKGLATFQAIYFQLMAKAAILDHPVQNSASQLNGHTILFVWSVIKSDSPEPRKWFSWVAPASSGQRKWYPYILVGQTPPTTPEARPAGLWPDGYRSAQMGRIHLSSEELPGMQTVEKEAIHPSLFPYQTQTSAFQSMFC